MKKNLVWLASYPKSGNTWTRAFIANYISGRDTPLPINDLGKFTLGDSIAEHYYRVAGRRFDTSDERLVLKYREGVLRGISNNQADINLLKTHQKNAIQLGRPLIPVQLTKAAVYVVRNPLDMVLSYARHYGQSIEEAVGSVCNSRNRLLSDANAIGGHLGSWAEHVASWSKFQPYPTLFLRYEDMLKDPHKEFRKFLEHLGVDVVEDRLNKAVEFSNFKELKQQEEKAGFSETSFNASGAFFGEGRSGHGRDVLEPEQIERIVNASRKQMERFGYLEE